MSTTSSVLAEGAELVYDIEGAGPLLLLIAGGNGDSARFTPLSSRLAGRYTVVKYDRRANVRSGGDTTAELDMAQAARDAAAIIRHVGAGEAYVFGTSAGANIALKFTQDFPELVRGLVVHEPPITDFLDEPDASHWRVFFDKVHTTFIEKGVGPAMGLFMSTFVGFPPMPQAVPGDQVGGDHKRFLAHEFQHINSFVPDIAALQKGGVPVAAIVGQASADAFYVQTARKLARELPCACVTVVSNHLGYALQPEAFANDLDAVIKSLKPATV